MQSKSYEIGNSISISIALITLNTSKIQPEYIIVEKKIEKNCLLRLNFHQFYLKIRTVYIVTITLNIWYH